MWTRSSQGYAPGTGPDLPGAKRHLGRKGPTFEAGDVTLMSRTEGNHER
jgi:hypothetical protein